MAEDTERQDVDEKASATADDGGAITRTLEEDPDPVQAGLAVTVIAAVATVGVGLATTSPPGLVEEGSASISAGLGTTLLWMFYAAHGIPVVVSAPEWGFAGPLVGSPVVYLLPPSVLLVGGFGIARTFGAETPRSAARNGAAIAVGYTLFCVAGLFVATFSVDTAFASLTVRPDPIWTVIAAIGYPLVFGAAGGLLAYAERTRR